MGGELKPCQLTTGLFFFTLRPPAPPVEKCSFWKPSSREPSGSSSNSTCFARTASRPSSAPSPSTSSAVRPSFSVPPPATSRVQSTPGQDARGSEDKFSPPTLNLWHLVASVLQGAPSPPFFRADSQTAPIPLKSVVFLLWEGQSSSIPGLSRAKTQAPPLNREMCSLLPRPWELLV